MKIPSIAVVLSAVVASALAADLVITPFDSTGTLTWTNSVTDATYQVQWASTVNGPWANLLALTKLDAVQGTGDSFSVKVPMFYRVAATTGATQTPEGTFLYRGYDAQGGLLNLGWLSLERWPDMTQTNVFRGTWALGYAAQQPSDGHPNKVFGHQFGEGPLLAGLGEPSTLTINMNANTANNNVYLSGKLESNRYTGRWSWNSFGTSMTNGTFVAEKVSNSPH